MEVNKLLLLVLLLGLCTASAQIQNWEGDKDDDRGSRTDRKCNKDGECDDDDQCDDERYFYEPCDYSDNVDCVRHFFGTNGKCSVVHYADKKPVYREKKINYFPYINLTVVLTNAKITGLNGNIEEFYINKKSRNLIMAVNFEGITINIKKAIFIASRRGKEPAVAADYANGTFPVTFTAVIPLYNGISLKDLRVTSYLPDAFPPFYVGPKVALSKDPAIARSVAGLFANIPTALQEFSLTEGPNLFLIYLQKHICDFNIPVSL